MFSYPIDSARFLRKKKSNKNTLLNNGKKRIKVKIAVLGGSTTSEITECLELFLLDYDIEPIYFISEYGNYWQTVMFPPENFISFKPEIVFIHTTTRNINEFPEISMNKDEVDLLIKEQYNHFSAIWDKLSDTFNCMIIQNNFELPFFRLLGNKDFTDYRGRISFINKLNALFSNYAEKHENFLINDINFISASYGLEKWSSPYYWNLYKYALAVPAIPEFSFNLANIIKSLYGKNKKALAIDLDNTLWGGVIGDDGLEGIQLGQDLSVGQAYLEFQSYIKSLKSLGIFLSVNSKNDLRNALLGLQHPDTILTADDFLVIKANWENKAYNIDDISSTLNIFPDSIVFLDDNPAERDIVKGTIGDVETPELDSVENYIRIIDRNAYFEFTALSDDDTKRNEMIKENIERTSQISRYPSYDEYLDSLKMSALIKSFSKQDIQRIVQLINKSNQFNLTTRRYTQPEIENISASSDYITLCGRLSDRFGENGIVSLVIGERKEDELHIDLWLMSCRVLKRDMEYAMLDCLIEKCKYRKMKKIYGYYYQTAKNEMVKDMYASFGFERVNKSTSSDGIWLLEIEAYENKNKHILVN